MCEPRSDGVWIVRSVCREESQHGQETEEDGEEEVVVHSQGWCVVRVWCSGAVVCTKTRVNIDWSIIE